MPLTLRRPTTSQQWSTRLLDGLLFLAAATALVWSLPMRLPWAGLDPGWVEALVQATDQGRIFGRDVVFTFGPYHQLYTGQVSENFTFLVLGRWIYGLGWGAAMLSLRRQVGHPFSWAILLVLALFTSQRLDALFNSFCLIITLTALCRIKQESLPLINYILQISTLILGILIKLSFVALAAPSLIILLSTELCQSDANKLKSLVKTIAIPLIGIGLMLPAGMNIADGWHYITGPNKEIVSGYSEAMALYRSRNDWQQLPYWLASAACIGAITTGLQQKLHWRNRWTVVATALIGTLYFWAPFKAGMVRHDGGHFPMSGLFLLTAGIVTLALFWECFRGKRLLMGIPLLLLPIGTGYTISSKRMDWDWDLYRRTRHYGIKQFWQANASFEGRSALLERRTEVLNHLKTRDDLTDHFDLPTSATADHLPWDTLDVINNKLTYTPRPIPHSLNAYSKRLLELNREFFADPKRRPEFVLLNQKVIDQRWPSTDIEGPALSEIARHYELHSRGTRGGIAMRERTDPIEQREQTLLQQAFDLRQNRSSSRPIQLPTKLPAGTSVSFNFKPNWLYKLRKALYRPGFVIRARVDFADGQHKKYRLVPSAAEELPLMPLPGSDDELLTYIQAKQGPIELKTPKEKQPVAIRLQLRRPGSRSSEPISRYFSNVELTLKAPKHR